MLLAHLAATSAAVAASSSRKVKVDLLAAALRRLPPAETAAGVAYLAGELRQRQIGVGWATLRDLPAAAESPTLSVCAVDAALDEVGRTTGPGSQTRRRDLLTGLFAAATPAEQQFLRAVLTGEVRQGALAGVLTDAVALAAGVPVDAVRRALLLSGDLKEVAGAALHGGLDALGEFHLTVGRPLAPMLAQPATDVAQAIERIRPAAVDWKLDGVRVQVHRDGDQVGVFTRSLDDVTARVPEIVDAARRLPVREVVLDGEAITVDEAGRPRPFQETSSRAARAGGATLTPYFFDLLHVDGADLIDEPAATRWSALDAVVPTALRVPRLIAADAEAAREAFAAALAAGHEGVVVKDPASRYEAGRRGGAWLKVKPRHTLDLVVLAAEWGHGRRRGWLSNLHLGARSVDGWVMLGKTFKGLTDHLLRWQTAELLAREVRRDDWTVYVRPDLVVEIAFDGVQTSPRYPGGVALRFARVLRYRDDKPAAEADTIDTVRALRG